MHSTDLKVKIIGLKKTRIAENKVSYLREDLLISSTLCPRSLGLLYFYMYSSSIANSHFNNIFSPGNDKGKEKIKEPECVDRPCRSVHREEIILENDQSSIKEYMCIVSQNVSLSTIVNIHYKMLFAHGFQD